MRAVLQRVKNTEIYADNEFRGEISDGLFILLGVKNGDTEKDAEILSEKIAKLRIFSDENGKMNLSVNDFSGKVAIVSNFTLYANYIHGNRPDYFTSAPPALAEKLYLYFVDEMKKRVSETISGVFGADMRINTVCDGPVTIILDSEILMKKE